MSRYHLGGELDYETPHGQRPTLSSSLLWVAERRNIPGVSLWVPVPFYLVAWNDPKAQRRVLEFFDQRFNLQIDFDDLDEEIKGQNEKIAQARNRSPEIDGAISRLESNLGLSEEEGEKLVNGLGEFLREKGG